MRKGSVWDAMVVIFAGVMALIYLVTGFSTSSLDDQSKEIGKVPLEIKDRYDEGNNRLAIMEQILDISYKESIDEMGFKGFSNEKDNGLFSKEQGMGKEEFVGKLKSSLKVNLDRKLKILNIKEPYDLKVSLNDNKINVELMPKEESKFDSEHVTYKRYLYVNRVFDLKSGLLT